MLTSDAPVGIQNLLNCLYPTKRKRVLHVTNKVVLPQDCDMNCDKCRNFKCSNKGGEGWVKTEIEEELVVEAPAAPVITTTRTRDEILADIPEDILDDVAKLIDDVGEDSVEWLSGPKKKVDKMV